jgi:hypothetical protein
VSRPLIIFLAFLGVVVFVAATAALDMGVQELRLHAAGPRRDYAAEELPPAARGWLAVFGCVRHDLAVAVAGNGRVYRLGAPVAGAADDDPVFTPLSARDDCDETRRPRRLYALIEDDDALGTTIGRVYQARVTPPPVPAFVDGVAGFSALAHGRAAAAAGRFLGGDGVAVDGLPLVVKGPRPGVLWVAILTAAAGAHGYLLLLVVALWSRRRRRRAAEQAHFTDEENEFLSQKNE